MHTQPNKKPGRERHSTPQAPRPLKRKIHFIVGDETVEWSYRITARGIRIQSPTGEHLFAPYTEIFRTGRQQRPWWSGDDEDQRVALTPSFVKAYIQVVGIEKRLWSYAEHVGGVYVGGVLVYKDALKASAENVAIRWNRQFPLRVVLTRAERGAWLTVDEIVERLSALDGEPMHKSRAIDLIVAMLSDGYVETQGALSYPAVAFRLRDSERSVPLNMPKVAVFQPHQVQALATAAGIRWLPGGDTDYIRDGSIPGATQLGSTSNRTGWARHGVKKGGIPLLVNDVAKFDAFCATHSLKPTIRDRF